MTAIPPALAAHLEQEVTTLCHCWRVIRTDGVVFGFTDHDQPLTVDGSLFEPHSGLAPTEARTSLGLTTDTLDVAGVLSSNLIKEEEIAAGLFDRAQVETILVNWREPSSFLEIRRAVVGKIDRTDGQFVAELESPLQNLDQPNGRYFRRSCDADLGDAQCGFDLSQSGFRGAGSVSAVVSKNIIEAVGLDGFADAWFSNGTLTWTSGPNTGRVLHIVTHRFDGSSTSLTLDQTNCLNLSTGDQFDIAAGCDKRFSTCKKKFSNALNFRGFPHLLGNDAAYAYAREGQSFDGAPLVP